MQATLAKWENAGGRTSITLELVKDGSIQLFYYDIGDDARRIYGDADYEAWVKIKPDQLPKLAFALLAEKLDGRPRAVSELRSFCAKYDVEFDDGVWT